MRKVKVLQLETAGTGYVQVERIIQTSENDIELLQNRHILQIIEEVKENGPVVNKIIKKNKNVRKS